MKKYKKCIKCKWNRKDSAIYCFFCGYSDSKMKLNPDGECKYYIAKWKFWIFLSEFIDKL